MGQICRADIFALADDACRDPDAALTMLWHAVAWGTGKRPRLCLARMRAARKVQRIGATLTEIAVIARTDPDKAYTRLCPYPGGNLIKYLGPSFATKYLYFAGGGDIGHPCLILDRRVALALRDHCRWTDLKVWGGWPVAVYEEYCQLLHRWAKDASQRLRRPVGADEYERCLFALGG